VILWICKFLLCACAFVYDEVSVHAMTIPRRRCIIFNITASLFSLDSNGFAENQTSSTKATVNDNFFGNNW
jgi:hypothetical protein